MRNRRPPSLIHRAPGFLGAFLLVGSLLLPFSLLSSCRGDREQGEKQPQARSAAADPWQDDDPPAAPPTAAAAAAAPASPRSGAKTGGRANDVGTATEAALPEGVRFIAYNVENWLTMDRTVAGRTLPGAPKPEKERQAVIRTLLSQKPDIAGLCELGGENDLTEIQQRLAAAGHPMEHRYLVGGSDPTRRLALISRYPISVKTPHDDLHYSLQGKSFAMQRGILDATVETPAGPLRFLGVHLKSKRETEESDQEEMRRNEAHLLRRELDAILRQDPAARLVVYGDMNDTRQSPAIRTIHGVLKDPTGLTMIPLKDSRGEYWTQHWSYQDVYSRIDYVMLSKALQDTVAWQDCRILDAPDWAEASDHRALRVVFRNREK